MTGVTGMTNFLTYEDIELAKRNGIGYQTASERVNKLKWSVEKAITTPVKRKEDHLWPKYRDLAAKHQITSNCFYIRMQKGMSPEQAATTPKVPHTNRRKPGKISKKSYEIAAQNGIKRKTLHARVYSYRWPIERAITEPINTQRVRRSQQESERQLKKAYEELETFASAITSLDLSGTLVQKGRRGDSRSMTKQLQKKIGGI